MNKAPSPPKFPLCFFRWFCHPDYQEDIAGYLPERFEKRMEQKGITCVKAILTLVVLRFFRPGIIGSPKSAQKPGDYNFKVVTQQLKIFLLCSVLWLSGGSTMAQRTLKMNSLHLQPIVVGKINGVRARFLVDSGSDVTLLNAADSEKYTFRVRRIFEENYLLTGLKAEHAHELLVARRIVLNLGGEEMGGTYKVFDLTHISRSFKMNINGIIGSDLMKKYNFIIDYEAGEIRFTGRNFVSVGK